MSSDCCSPTDDSCAVSAKQLINAAICPSCGQKGKSVDTQTVKAMLLVSLEAVRPLAVYRFCRTLDCPVVYFDETGLFFTEADVRERVYQKHAETDNVFVCYCFQHTPGTIRAEFTENKSSDVVERITTGTKAGVCACEIRNPQGSCCLGNVRAVVKQISAELEPILT